MKKRILSGLVAIVLLVGCIPRMANAVWYGDLWINYEKYDDPESSTYVTLDGCNDVENLFVPSTIDGLPVIGTNLFGECSGLKNLTTLTISEGF